MRSVPLPLSFVMSSFLQKPEKTEQSASSDIILWALTTISPLTGKHQHLCLVILRRFISMGEVSPFPDGAECIHLMSWRGNSSGCFGQFNYSLNYKA